MAEEDDQDFIGYAGRDGGKAMMADMEQEKQWKMLPEPGEEERAQESRHGQGGQGSERGGKDEKRREKKSKDKDKKRSKSKEKKKKERKLKRDKKEKRKKRGGSSSSSSSSEEDESDAAPDKEEVLALDKQLRELGLPVRVFGERHVDRLQRWSQEKEKRLSQGEEVANPNREAWMTISAEGSAEADGAAVAGEGGEGVKAAALMGSLDSLLMGMSSRSEKQQKRDANPGGVELNDDKPAFLKHMADIKEGRAPGAAGLWMNPNKATDEGKREGLGEKEAAAAVTVGDGGNSWKARQLARLKERAAAEGKTLQDLAEDRASASLSDLQKAERESRGSKASYGRGGGGAGGGGRRAYLDDVGSGARGGQRMIRPDDRDGEGLKWKNNRREEDRKKEYLWDRTGEASLTGPDQANKFRNDGSFVASFLKKEGASEKRQEREQKREQERRAGDWTCPKCGANVFASKSECFKCHTPNPSPASLEPKYNSGRASPPPPASVGRGGGRDGGRGRGSRSGGGRGGEDGGVREDGRGQESEQELRAMLQARSGAFVASTMSTGFDNTNPTMPRAAEAQPKAAPVAPAAEMSIQDFNRQIRKAGPVAAAAATACGGDGGTGEGASDVDRNKLEAQLMRAEMRGDNEKVSALKAQLASIVTGGGAVVGGGNGGNGEGIGARGGGGALAGGANAGDNVVELQKFDVHGRPLSLSFVSDLSDRQKATRDYEIAQQKKVDLAKGEREKYFNDDDMSLDEMVRREKLGKGTPSDYDSNAVDNVGAKRKGKIDGGAGVYDEEMEYGAGLQTSLQKFESRDKRMRTDKLEDRARQQMIGAHHKAEVINNKDRYSLEHPKFPKHMLVAVATRCYLMLQTQGRLCDGHCLIVPSQLVVSLVQCDEDTLEEIRNFKKCLLQTFHQMDQDCVFFESAMGLDRMPHAYLECVPMPRAKAANAPMYFKKAINESENEFETQNKALIDTRGVRKLSSKIPRHMPYFSVEFGLQGGFAHVIENERKFSRSFGFDILAGILGVQANIVSRERQSIEQERKLAQGFKASFDPFDWTKALR